ncbi:MAG: alanine:cation symporter family protein [Eubacteriales bacterium]|nr:alanine:cation symporter family protein [Eubacteriales bacterium]
MAELINNITNWFEESLNIANDFLYTYILVALLLIVGIYFTIRTKFVQVRLLGDSIKVIAEKKSDKKGVSSFQALMVSTASRVGTGNIVGVASAIAIGGAGSVFWMWTIAIIGSASAFIESTLAQIYKTKDGEGFKGGPAYYIEKALKKRWLGIVFSILMIACFAYGFNGIQSYNISSSLAYYFPNYYESILPMVVGLIVAILTGVIIFGGVKRIGFITSGLVPIMAVLYILLGIFITFKNITSLPQVFSNIFTQAFDFKAIFGGFSGSCVMYGIKRGLFSNEAGMGSAPNAAATAEVSHPVKQGLVQMFSVFIDTLFICTTTAMILLCSGVVGGENLKGVDFVQVAVRESLGEFGIHFITISMFLFAFSSLIGNYYYTESNIKFITPNKIVLNLFRVSCIFMIFFGTQLSFDTVWNLADVLMGLMAIINIVVIVILGNISIKALKDYTKQKKDGKDPTFKAKDIGLDNTEYWK